MKKYFLIGIIMAIVPNICFGASARFTQLAREKERKMAELEKCMGSTKGLKIAGISTLGLSAVGVAANVVEAKKIKDYDSSIESTQQQIEKTQTEIERKQKELSQIQNSKQAEKPTPESTPTNENKNGPIGAWKDFYNLCGVIPVSGDTSFDQSGEACSGLNKGEWVLNGTKGNSVCKTKENSSICTCNVDGKSTAIEMHESQDDCLDECTVACITEFNSSKLAGPYNLETPSNQNQPGTSRTSTKRTSCVKYQ